MDPMIMTVAVGLVGAGAGSALGYYIGGRKKSGAIAADQSLEAAIATKQGPSEREVKLSQENTLLRQLFNVEELPAKNRPRLLSDAASLLKREMAQFQALKTSRAVVWMTQEGSVVTQSGDEDDVRVMAGLGALFGRLDLWSEAIGRVRVHDSRGQVLSFYQCTTLTQTPLVCACWTSGAAPPASLDGQVRWKWTNQSAKEPPEQVLLSKLERHPMAPVALVNFAKEHALHHLSWVSSGELQYMDDSSKTTPSVFRRGELRVALWRYLRALPAMADQLGEVEHVVLSTAHTDHGLYLVEDVKHAQHVVMLGTRSGQGGYPVDKIETMVAQLAWQLVASSPSPEPPSITESAAAPSHKEAS